MSLWDEPTIYYALQQHFCGAFVYFTLSLGGIQSLSGISYVAKSQLIQSFQTYTAVRKQWRAQSPNSIYFLMENMTIARCMREQMHRWEKEKKNNNRHGFCWHRSQAIFFLIHIYVFSIIHSAAAFVNTQRPNTKKEYTS